MSVSVSGQRTASPPIAYRRETYRTVSPDQTWDRVRPLLPEFGITRVADITGLDDLGIATYVAYRPVGRTLAVSVGTGLSPAQARVSAVMESIETWHAENPAAPVTHRGRARDLDLGYAVRDLALARNSPVSSATLLDWVPAAGLRSGRPTLVPMATVLLDACVERGAGLVANTLFSVTSNGLASGNTMGEAVLHGLLEAAERECMSRLIACPKDDRVVVDPDSVANPVAEAVLAAVRAADCLVWVWDMTTELGLPAYFANIWSEAVPMVFAGAGCHLDPGVALGRALAEAAQSRLVAVAGARDDIGGDAYRSPNARAGTGPMPEIRPGQPIQRPAYQIRDLDAMIDTVTARITEHTGIEPFAVDLTHAELGIPVSKVYTPRLRMYSHHDINTLGVPTAGRPNGASNA